jgi:hypothetical protein
VAERAGVLGPKLTLEGAVSGLTTGEQAGEQIVQFVVQPGEGLPVPVVLRGNVITGPLADGDRVALIAPWKHDDLEDRTLRPLKFRNLTTGGVVSVERQGLRQIALRAGIAALREAWLKVIGFAVVGAALTLGVKVGTGAVVEEGTRTVERFLFFQGFALAIAFILIAWAYRRWRWEGGPLPVVTAVVALVIFSILGAGLWWTYTA